MSSADLRIEPFGERATLVRISAPGGIEESARISNFVADQFRQHSEIEDAVAGIIADIKR